jgi:two-component system nitrate/nitrite response regulator NarL
MSVTRPCFLLVDDHALFRTGLGLMLAQAWPDAQVQHAASLRECVAMLPPIPPDLILLDVQLPDGHGLADLPQVRAASPDVPVLLMSAEFDAELVGQAREAGAIGFLPKSASFNEVLAAVRSALAGQYAFASVPYSVLLGGEQPLPDEPTVGSWFVHDTAPTLSGRQLSILGYLGRGTPNKAIARQLGMSEMDVRAEVSWLTEMLGASSREEAHAHAVARGLLPA